MQRFILTAFLSGFLLLSCSKPPLKSGIDHSNFDTSVRPQDDLYRYVNGTWLKRTKIPADKSDYGAFTALYDKAQKQLRGIIESAAKAKNNPGSDGQKVGDFYLSYMDTARIEQLGIQPLQKQLDTIAHMKSYEELEALIARLKAIGVQAPFSFYVNQDVKNSDKYIIYISQSGLGLPDRDYYLKQTPRYKKIRKSYVYYMSKLFSLAKITHPLQRAKRILDMETQMAAKQWTRTRNRDVNQTYNLFTFKKLTQITPRFNWEKFFKAVGIEGERDVVVRQPGYLSFLNKFIPAVSVKDWQSYFMLKTLSHFASYLNKDFVAAQFDFYGKTLRGIQKNRPRWKRAVSTVNGALGKMVGKIYVRKYFKPEAKKRMKELVQNLFAAYKERLEKLDWMSEKTKNEALNKLANIGAKIGYPDKWKDYSGLEINKEQLVQNEMRSSRFEFKRNINRLGKPVDRSEWYMNPQTVNAYYDGSMNEVVFPAAILQPPFFNMQADDAVNYGGIGAVIGHELTHGFDDQGSKMDAKGNLRDWWTKEDRAKFTKRAQRLVKQYSAYIPIDTLHLNGKLTLGENIADLGGLTIAYAAYKRSLHGAQAPVIDGFSGDQRFFIGWAQVWKRKYRDDALRQRLLTDPHSPSAFRADGVPINVPAFYSAFHVKKGDKMYKAPDERITIW